MTKVTIKVQNPEEVAFDLTISASSPVLIKVSDALAAQLKNSFDYQVNEIRRAIDDALMDIERTFIGKSGSNE